MPGKTFLDLKVDNFEVIVKNLDPPDIIALGKVLRGVLSIGDWDTLFKDHCNHSASFWSQLNYCPSRRDVELVHILGMRPSSIMSKIYQNILINTYASIKEIMAIIFKLNLNLSKLPLLLPWPPTSRGSWGQ